MFVTELVSRRLVRATTGLAAKKIQLLLTQA